MGKKHERTHAEIVRHAARLFREHGTESVGVDDVMSAAGLTRGGFYAHFASKEALIVEAIDHAFDEARRNLFARDADAFGLEWLELATRTYLATAHVKAPGEGCVVPALAGEIARRDKTTRAAFERGVEGVLEEIQMRLSKKTKKEAIILLSMWVGALAIARAVDSESLSKEVLGTIRGKVLGEAAVYTSLPRGKKRDGGARRRISARRNQPKR